jgi:hypothetical protein
VSGPEGRCRIRAEAPHRDGRCWRTERKESVWQGSGREANEEQRRKEGKRSVRSSSSLSSLGKGSGETFYVLGASFSQRQMLRVCATMQFTLSSNKTGCSPLSLSEMLGSLGNLSAVSRVDKLEMEISTPRICYHMDANRVKGNDRLYKERKVDSAQTSSLCRAGSISAFDGNYQRVRPRTFKHAKPCFRGVRVSDRANSSAKQGQHSPSRRAPEPVNVPITYCNTLNCKRHRQPRGLLSTTTPDGQGGVSADENDNNNAPLRSPYSSEAH